MAAVFTVAFRILPSPVERHRAPEREHLQGGGNFFVPRNQTKPQMQATLTITREEYTKLKCVVMNNSPAVHEYLDALVKIRDTKAYTHDCPSWQEWCNKFAGRTAAAVRMFQYRERKRLNPSKPKPTIEVSAKRDRTQNIEAAPRVPEPEPPPAAPEPPAIVEPPRPKPAPLPPSAAEAARQLARDLESLKRETAFALNDKFRHCCTLANLIVSSLQPVLPGMEPHVSTKGKGSRDDVIAYAVELELQKLDGEWFFDKNQGIGWKVNGKPIEDWRSVMRAWKKLGVFPSLKQTTNSNYGSRPNQPRSSGRNQGTYNDPEQYAAIGSWNPGAR